MDVNKVLYISQEISPYLNPSPMATLSQRLPQGIQERGMEVRTFMPKYGCINERRNQLHEVIRLSGMNIIIDDTDHPLIIKVATLQPVRMQVYFIDNDDYFHHHASTALETETCPDDNDERIMFFVRGVMETVKKLRWIPSVVHCSGWISALAPVYLKHVYQDDPAFRSCKVIYSLFDSGFSGTLSERMPDKLVEDGVAKESLSAIAENPVDYIALNKLAIDHSDGIVQAAGNVDPVLLEYARSTGKPFLAFPGDDEYVDAYDKFYHSL